MGRNFALTEDEIREWSAALPEWRVVERTPEGADHAHRELHRMYSFANFADAMHFMLTASRYIQVSDHHPCWQNMYSRVEVWITTGELRHQLSKRDFTLARYLENLFGVYYSPSS